MKYGGIKSQIFKRFLSVVYEEGLTQILKLFIKVKRGEDELVVISMPSIPQHTRRVKYSERKKERERKRERQKEGKKERRKERER